MATQGRHSVSVLDFVSNTVSNTSCPVEKSDQHRGALDSFIDE